LETLSKIYHVIFGAENNENRKIEKEFSKNSTK